MTFNQFKTVIESLEKASKRSHAIYQLGVELTDYDDLWYTLSSTLLESIFDKEGKDWIDWYLYERVGFDGRILKAFDENNNEICHNIESLWETVQTHLN